MSDFILGFFAGWTAFGLLVTYGEARWGLVTKLTRLIIGKDK